MPHIIVEYSANLVDAADLQRLFMSFHEALAQLGVEIEDCKSRAYRCDVYRVGAGAPARAFFHITLAVLDCRSPEVQREAGEMLLGILQRSVVTDDLECDFTVEVRPMRSEGYFKVRTASRLRPMTSKMIRSRS
jgi:5-carboxymethyl-2-hydroxymuconate isomerase